MKLIMENWRGYKAQEREKHLSEAKISSIIFLESINNKKYSDKEVSLIMSDNSFMHFIQEDFVKMIPHIASSKKNVLKESVRRGLSGCIESYWDLCETRQFSKPKRRIKVNEFVGKVVEYVKDKIKSFFNPLFTIFSSKVDVEEVDKKEVEREVEKLQDNLSVLDKFISNSSLLANFLIYQASKLASGALKLLKNAYHVFVLPLGIYSFASAVVTGNAAVLSFFAIFGTVLIVAAMVERVIERATRKRRGIQDTYMRIPNALKEVSVYLDQLYSNEEKEKLQVVNILQKIASLLDINTKQTQNT
mgnify:CR=1 FL=1